MMVLDCLRPRTSFVDTVGTETQRVVSILVLMEDSQREIELVTRLYIGSSVSILVLMDDSQRAVAGIQTKR